MARTKLTGRRRRPPASSPRPKNSATKRTFSQSESPHQAVQEPVVRDLKRPRQAQPENSVNPLYWYTDQTIEAIVRGTIARDLGGFRTLEGLEAYYLLKDTFTEGTTPYHIAITPAVATVGTLPLAFVFDKAQLPAPVNQNQNEGGDVFDEIAHCLLAQGSTAIKILTPFNQGLGHWLTLETQIRKLNHGSDNPAVQVKLFLYDPYALQTRLLPEEEEQISAAIRKRITDILGDEVNLTIESQDSPYRKPQQHFLDKSSCGPITVDNILQRIQGQSLLRDVPYPIGAQALRLRHQQFFEENRRLKQASHMRTAYGWARLGYNAYESVQAGSPQSFLPSLLLRAAAPITGFVAGTATVGYHLLTTTNPTARSTALAKKRGSKIGHDFASYASEGLIFYFNPVTWIGTKVVTHSIAFAGRHLKADPRLQAAAEIVASEGVYYTYDRYQQAQVPKLPPALEALAHYSEADISNSATNIWNEGFDQFGNNIGALNNYFEQRLFAEYGIDIRGTNTVYNAMLGNPKNWDKEATRALKDVLRDAQRNIPAVAGAYQAKLAQQQPISTQAPPTEMDIINIVNNAANLAEAQGQKGDYFFILSYTADQLLKYGFISDKAAFMEEGLNRKRDYDATASYRKKTTETGLIAQQADIAVHGYQTIPLEKAQSLFSVVRGKAKNAAKKTAEAVNKAYGGPGTFTLSAQANTDGTVKVGACGYNGLTVYEPKGRSPAPPKQAQPTAAKAQSGKKAPQPAHKATSSSAGDPKKTSKGPWQASKLKEPTYEQAIIGECMQASPVMVMGEGEADGLYHLSESHGNNTSYLATGIAKAQTEYQRTGEISQQTTNDTALLAVQSLQWAKDFQFHKIGQWLSDAPKGANVFVNSLGVMVTIGFELAQSDPNKLPLQQLGDALKSTGVGVAIVYLVGGEVALGIQGAQLAGSAIIKLDDHLWHADKTAQICSGVTQADGIFEKGKYAVGCGTLHAVHGVAEGARAVDKAVTGAMHRVGKFAPRRAGNNPSASAMPQAPSPPPSP